VDTQYINPVLKSIVNVMKTMVRQDVKRGEIVVKENTLAFGEVSAVINLEGEQGRGSISASFPIDVLLNIAKIMLPPSIKVDNYMLKDLTGELANMFAGGAQAIMESEGIKYQISLPSIVAGKPHHIRHQHDHRSVLIPFSSDVGTFFVEVSFD